MKQKSLRMIGATSAGAAVVLSLIVGVAPVASAQKPAPPPCAPDGTCLPNRGAWGFYATNWNRWPGAEPEEPTEAELAEEDEQLELPEGPAPPEAVREELLGVETPSREGTGVPGAPTTPPAEAPTPAPDAAPPGDAPTPDVELPDIDSGNDLFDPFGRNGQGPTGADELPQADGFDAPARDVEPEPTLEVILQRQQEDAPPALPPSLRQAARQTSLPNRSASHSPDQPRRKSQPDVQLSQPTSLTVVGSRRAAPAATGSIQQAAWAEGGVRQASSATASATDQPDGVRQAIYIEASDQ